jgi:DNA (cytosine-5)-methyltransferase 1
VNHRPLAIDLFAGAGGLSLGFEQAGFDIAAAVEYDPIHAATHELNFPKTSVICASVRDMTGDEIRKRAGIGNRAIDVVIGGPPCQGFSLIGHRVLEDARNDLVFHFLRLVDELRPKTFVMENVPGMASGDHHQLLDELIDRFDEADYRVVKPYAILNAANYGVPQDRRRLFVIGARKGIRQPHYPEPGFWKRIRNGAKESPLDRSLREAGKPASPSVSDALEDLPDIESFETLRDTDILENANLGRASRYAAYLRDPLLDPKDFSNPRVHDPEILTGCLRAEHTETSRTRFAATVPGATEPISRFFRLPPDGLSNTLRAGTATDRGAFSAPRPIHPVFARCISVREAARLHSFPDWFRFHRTIWHGFRQIGNAVPPLLGRAVAEEIRSALGISPTRDLSPLPLGAERLAYMTMREAAEHFGVHPRTIAVRQRRIHATV